VNSNHFKGQIMLCTVTNAAGMYSLQSKIISERQVFNFGHLSSRHYIYVSKDMMICSYFLNQNEPASKKKSLGHTVLDLSRY